MTITEFKAYVKTGQALDTDEIHGFMHEMSEEARRVTFRLNTAYHTADEVRELLSELFGYQVPSRSVSFHRFMRILERTSLWVKACLSMPVAIFRIMEE